MNRGIFSVVPGRGCATPWHNREDPGSGAGTSARATTRIATHAAALGLEYEAALGLENDMTLGWENDMALGWENDMTLGLKEPRARRVAWAVSYDGHIM